MITGTSGFIGGFLSKNIVSPNTVIHCAAAKTYKEDLALAKKVFDQALEDGHSVIFLSSISVYGDVTDPEVTESTIPKNQTSYAEAKWDIEKLLKTYDLDSLSLRLPGVVGPGAHDIFLSRTLARIKEGRIVEAHHPDSLFNNVVHILDLNYFIQGWLSSPVIGHHTINLGASDPITIREVIDLMGGEAIYRESQKTPFLISIEKAVSLGFQPPTVRDSIKSYTVDLT